jgi:rhodanese-related sulfurtransferase
LNILIKIKTSFLILLSLLFWNFSVSQIDRKYQQLLISIYDDFPTISTNQLDNLMKSKKNNIIILDTREKNEFDVSHIPSAIWVGYTSFDISKLKNTDKNKKIIVYCSVGARSQEIGKKLSKNNFITVYNLYGGIFQWYNEDRIILDSKNQKTKFIHGYDDKWSKWLKNGNKENLLY